MRKIVLDRRFFIYPKPTWDPLTKRNLPYEEEKNPVWRDAAKKQMNEELFVRDNQRKIRNQGELKRREKKLKGVRRCEKEEQRKSVNERKIGFLH